VKNRLKTLNRLWKKWKIQTTSGGDFFDSHCTYTQRRDASSSRLISVHCRSTVYFAYVVKIFISPCKRQQSYTRKQLRIWSLPNK